MARAAIQIPGTIEQAIGTVGFSQFSPNASGVIDASDAFSRAIQQSATTKQPVAIPAGTYLINTAPGTIPNAALHDCPQVEYDYIDLIAAGGPVVLKAATAVTAARAALGSTQATSKPLLKAISTTGGVFRLRGQFIIDGAITTAPSTDNQTLADPQACALLEVQGYGTVLIDDLTIRNFYGNRDNRVGGGVYDGAQWRRCGIVIDNNKRVKIGLTTGETWREGPFISARNRDIEVDFRFVGMASYPASGVISTPLNIFWGGADASNQSLLVNFHDWSGVWSGSAWNIATPGDLVANHYCTVVGKIDTGSVNNNQPVSSAGSYGGGGDNSAEVITVPSRSITINGLTMKDVLRYGYFLYRTDTSRIGRLKADIDIDGGGRGVIVSYIDHVELTLRTRNIYALTNAAGQGIDLNIANVKTGYVRVDGDGSGTKNWTYVGDPLPATKTSLTAIFGRDTGSVRFEGKLHNYALRFIDYNYSDSGTVTDNAEDLVLGDLRMTRGSYTVSADSGAFVRIGRNAGARARRVEMAEATFDGVPLVASTMMACFAVSLPGALTRVIGNPSNDITVGSVLGTDLVWNGDGSDLQMGYRGAIEWRAGSNGRGASWTVQTSYKALAKADRLSVLEEGQVQFWPITTPEFSGAGQVFYSTDGNYYAYDSAAVQKRVPLFADATRKSLIIGNDSANIAQNALLGGLGFYNGDGSQSVIGVKGGIYGYANDGQGRGADVAIEVTASNGTQTNALKAFGDTRLAHGGSLRTIVSAVSHLTNRAYTIATLPTAANPGEQIFVSDGTSNKRFAVADGTNWRWPDGAVVS